MSNGEVVTIGEYNRLKAERTLYHDALLSIRRKADAWNSNNLGGLAIQRKRWRILGDIARQALANWPESATESTSSVNE